MDKTMANFFKRRAYESIDEADTKLLLQDLIIVKNRIACIDQESEDFSLTGNLLIDLYEISEELEKRLIL